MCGLWGGVLWFNGVTSRVSVASDGAQGDDGSGVPAVSADGRYVAFYSYAGNLVSGDTNGYVDIFVRDRQARSDLITEIRIPWGAGQGASERVARPPADYPIVSVTAWQPEGGAVRLAATGIDTLPVRLTAAEAALVEGGIDKAVEMAGEECRHPGDFRGDHQYRAQMAAVLTRRVLAHLE